MIPNNHSYHDICPSSVIYLKCNINYTFCTDAQSIVEANSIYGAMCAFE